MINPDSVSAPLGPYSHAALASGSRLLFIGGQVAVNVGGELVGRRDPEAQTRQILMNIQAIIEAAGGTMRDIVMWTWYDVDIQKHQAANRRVRMEFIGSEPPPATKVEVQALADPDYLMEVDAIAVLD
jgi:2-iminobutanoate/2-iminopropanoate deaminase